MKIRVVDFTEILKKYQNGENLENYQVIHKWNSFKGFHMKDAAEASLEELKNGVIVELY